MSGDVGAERPCGSCGDPAPYTIRLRGRPMPACLRHLNHWRTPPPDYTCPTACVEANHPGREHNDWLTSPEILAAQAEALREVAHLWARPGERNVIYTAEAVRWLLERAEVIEAEAKR